MPSFPPQALTTLDHLIIPSYLSGVSTFDLRGRDKAAALSRLELAAARLVTHLPFLGGDVAPAGDRDEKLNAYELRSADNDRDPFLQVKEHPASTPLLINGQLNAEFVPGEEVIDFSQPCPVLRLQANIVGDTLHLVSRSHHMALDGMGGSVVGNTLSQLCRNPDTPPADLPTTAAEQRRMQEHLLRMASSSTPEALRWTPKPFNIAPLDMTDPRNVTLNRKYRISAGRIRRIKSACEAIIRDHAPSELRDVRFSSSLVIGALIGLCCYRARQAAGLGDWYGPTLDVAYNIRQQLGLPATYMGNAVVTVECQLDGQYLSSNADILSSPDLGISSKDLQGICNTLLSLVPKLREYSASHVAGMLGTLNALQDRSAVQCSFRGLAYSDTHKMDFFQDYGPLGEVQSFAIPGNEFAGVCWLLATRPGVEDYELQVGLEGAAMGELERDALLKWVGEIREAGSRL
ncbi:uncharacterized protein DSM5745_09370 [Aspergillus mulundensis]|uniref:Uncharacterized protein n=1 Tax=Aspergillus mulundensis TaxID=1810919 RepID=A0A3D8QVB4_9EURO|nr:hypothetical protein DSM5745_09370 [Aspergillus mulundensis]RDW65631.1 hypothetical protein DSM5745_09370 [Aspergillus mulundensis]